MVEHTLHKKYLTVTAATLRALRHEFACSLWPSTAKRAGTYTANRSYGGEESNEKFNALLDNWLWEFRVRSRLGARDTTIKSTSPTVLFASWRLVRLRAEAALGFLSLQPLKNLLAFGVAGMSQLARADYIETWLTPE